ncbi:NACHT domain-containing NTPase [Lentzea sp. CC55]|uniref:NACHT domain-containing protein n=1 Tax=Lentzea sp. CC55 TaxID=2884909 RepID=UPI001F180370|nr:NACHT domain-containing protein [Lentzea sp. CC55]MCG8926789.1 NACHT domain-containing protein [Lentzea sp. CC55]
MAGIESAVIRVVVGVSDQLSARLTETVDVRQPSSAATEGLLADLGRSDVEALDAYLGSPDFAAVVAQKRIGDLAGKSSKDQLREGLRLAGLPAHLLVRATDTVHDVMVAACQEVSPLYAGTSAKIDRSDLYTAAINNSALLKRLKSLTRVHAFAARMRDQVVALHSRIRMPHVGVSRSVRYDQLYVEPTLASPFLLRLGAPGERVLVQGDPGAGKSTLAAKFAHDVAVSGRVPFLLVLREFATSFDEGGHDLLHYLEKLCQAPYNVKPPRDGVEYLLRTGRGVVVLDGLDELVQTELRRRVVSLVEGFAHLYPLVPILVTARKVGYEDAPLSTELFLSSTIEEFDSQRVAGYVQRWFTLDEATSPAERSRLITSFMEDSAQIPELRSNPLLLTLLCAMYSSDRYLPRNLAQVYERCALMLFEQWDSKRGITLPLKFHGRLRGAVQHLAWRMFTAAESGKAMPRTRIINVLVDYLEAKLDDHDESSATAEEFLAFCTGRAWILTDVGAERYGFTHRTFLEYFAAEHVVRTRRTAADLWATLRPDIEQWDVVAQIALQLYDRNVDGGVDELLTEALADGGLGFAARSLRHVHPAARTVRAITTAAVDHVVLSPVELHLEDEGASAEIYAPLLACVLDSSAANAPSIGRAFLDRIGELVQRGEPGVALMVETLYSGVARHLAQAVIRTHLAELADLSKALPWAGGVIAVTSAGVVPEIIRRHGMRALFLEHYSSEYGSFASAVFEGGCSALPDPDSVATAITEAPTPWPEDAMSVTNWIENPATTLQVLLSLPALEWRCELTNDRRVPPPSWDGGSTPQVREFLARWQRGEFSVATPIPELPRRLPGQR